MNDKWISWISQFPNLGGKGGYAEVGCMRPNGHCTRLSPWTMLGRMCAHSWDSKAAEFYEKACEAGRADGCNELAGMNEY